MVRHRILIPVCVGSNPTSAVILQIRRCFIMVQVDCQMCEKKPADMRLLKHPEYNCPIFVCADCAEKEKNKCPEVESRICMF